MRKSLHRLRFPFLFESDEQLYTLEDVGDVLAIVHEFKLLPGCDLQVP